MSNTKPSQHQDTEQLQNDLLEFIDEFKEYKCYTTFLNTAFVAVMANERIDRDVIDGAQQCAEELRSRFSGLEAIIKLMPNRLSKVLSANDDQR